MTVLCPIANFAVLTGPVGSAFSESHDALTTLSAPDTFLTGLPPDRLLCTSIRNAGGASRGGGRANEVQTLIARLRAADRDNYELINTSINRLIQIGVPSVGPLIKILRDRDKNEYVRQLAAYALGVVKDSRAIEPLIQACEDNNSSVRFEAMHSLSCYVELPRVIDKLRKMDIIMTGLIKMLNDQNEDADIRGDAAMALGEMGDSRAVDPLIEALKKEKVLNVRMEEAIALGKFVDPLISRTLGDGKLILLRSICDLLEEMERGASAWEEAGKNAELSSIREAIEKIRRLTSRSLP